MSKPGTIGVYMVWWLIVALSNQSTANKTAQNERRETRDRSKLQTLPDWLGYVQSDQANGFKLDFLLISHSQLGWRKKTRLKRRPNDKVSTYIVVNVNNEASNLFENWLINWAIYFREGIVCIEFELKKQKIDFNAGAWRSYYNTKAIDFTDVALCSMIMNWWFEINRIWARGRYIGLLDCTENWYGQFKNCNNFSGNVIQLHMF